METEPLASTKDVIKALGGSTAVGRLTGRKVQAVSNWAGFSTFPANTFLTMQAALREAGREAPAWLWGMEAKPAAEERVA
jgi:hypothetical protein